MGVDDDPKTQTTPSEALAVTDFKQTRNTDLEQELALIGIPGEPGFLCYSILLLREPNSFS